MRPRPGKRCWPQGRRRGRHCAQGTPATHHGGGGAAGSAPDAQGALKLVAQSERHTGGSVTATIAVAAYGDGETRQQFADAGRTLIARIPKRLARAHFPKEDFQIDLATGTCTCPLRSRCMAVGSGRGRQVKSASAGSPVAG